MKKIYLITFLLFTAIIFGQNEPKDKENKNTCEVSENFKEPLRDKKTKKWAKRMNKFGQNNFPTLLDIKKHVAIDNDCEIKKVILLQISEQSGNGIYVLCVKGKKIKYKRIGTVIMRNGENPLSKF